jgi:membrane protease YdiL (CAAX protease family)
MPQDPAQLLFLAGTVCLVIAPRLSWWPAGFEIATEHRADWLNLLIHESGGAILFPVLFAGIAAYFIAFWPGPHPVRRILLSIYLPTLLIIAIQCLRLTDLVRPYHSVLEAASSHSPGPIFAILRVPGLQFCLAGLLLIGVFMGRLIAGRSSLPLALPPGSLQRHDHPEIWRRTQILIWVVIGPLFLTTTFMILPLLVSSNFSRYLQLVWFSSVANAVQMLLVVAVASYIIGRSTAPMLRRALRLPVEKNILLAAAFAIGIPALISAGQYLWERAQFVRHDVGTVIWEPGSYFHFPEPWLFLLFFPALLEEIIFRGFLQPRLTERYGLYRGIFLVGIVWSAFHFPSDVSFSHFSASNAILQVAFRLFLCIGQSFVLGWLTWETGSVLAPALAHTFYNVLIYSDLGPPFPGKPSLRAGLWAALAWILFRYWPVRPASPETFGATETLVAAPSAPAEPSPLPTRKSLAYRRSSYVSRFFFSLNTQNFVHHTLDPR